MKTEKRKSSLLPILLACVLVACAFSMTACSTDEFGNAPGVIVDTGSGSSTPGLTWTTTSSSMIRIVKDGMHPQSSTANLNYGFDYETLKSKGYTTLRFRLEFSVYVDSGLNVSTTVSAFLKDKDKKDCGVNWGNMNFTNTNAYKYDAGTVITQIDALPQTQGNLYLTFEAVKNTFQTGTYINNIKLTITAE